MKRLGFDLRYYVNNTVISRNTVHDLTLRISLFRKRLFGMLRNVP